MRSQRLLELLAGRAWDVAVGAVAILGLLLLGAYLVASVGAGLRGEALAAAAAFTLVIAAGLYAWRLGTAG